MSTPTKYIKSLQNDFVVAHNIASDRLTLEIQASTIVPGLSHIDTAGDTVDLWFKDTLSDGETAVLTGIVSIHSGVPLIDNTPQRVQLTSLAGVPVPCTSDSRVRFSAEKGSGSRTNFYTCDWTDPTTWYQASTYVANETTTYDAGDTANKTWLLAHSPVIDNCHGNITQEDFIKDAAGHSYRVAVTVGGAAKVEQDPHFGTGGDYTVDYLHGKILFLSAQDPAAVVVVTYHYVNMAPANGTASKFVIAPTAGKRLVLSLAECQFSTDVDMTDSVLFEIWGIADFFLTSAQMTAYGIPAGVGYKINLQTFVYKALSDFQNDAMRAYPTYPSLGNPSNWRSQVQPVTVFDWDYVTGSAIQATKGMEIRVYLQHDKPFNGWMATATLYMTSEDDA
jgi:hypothetical protein